MFDSVQSPAARKRRAPEEPSDNEACVLPSKKQKIQPTSPARHSQPEAAAFWDGLSRIVLSRHALKEFDRRTQAQSGGVEISVSRVPNLPRGRQRKLLKRFARQGGPSLAHLRGFAHLSSTMTKSSGQGCKRLLLSDPTETTKTSKTSPYSGQYEAGLNDAHIYVEGHDYGEAEAPEPENLSAIRERLMSERASLSPSRFTMKDFKDFKRATAQSRSESKLVRRVIREVAGKDDHFKTEADIVFNNIEAFNKGLTAAKPDSYDGALRSSLSKPVRDELGPLIIPSTSSTNPIAPNFFLEAKSDKGSEDVALKQACHDGAIGARAMHSLQNYGASNPIYDGNAESFSTTYHSGTLKFFSTHATAPVAEGEPPEYHMTQIDALAITGSYDALRKGITYYRNARDMAQEIRDKRIKEANDMAKALLARTSMSSRHGQASRTICRSKITPEAAEAASDTSEDELALSPVSAASDTSEDELALSPVPSKRLRREPLPSTPRVPLPPSQIPTPPSTSMESVSNVVEDSDNAGLRRSVQKRPSAQTRASLDKRRNKGRNGRSV